MFETFPTATAKERAVQEFSFHDRQRAIYATVKPAKGVTGKV